MLRGGTFYCRVWVPADVAPIFGRTLVVTSLRTKDPKVARSRLARCSVELEEQFDRLRQRSGTTQPPERVSDDELLAKSREHAIGVVEKTILDQTKFFKRATESPARLWRGDLTPLPSPTTDAHHFTHYDRLVAEGDLEAVIAYLQRFRLRERINELMMMRATGNLEEFVALSQTLHPQLNDGQRALFARLLLTEELRTLEAVEKNELFPAPNERGLSRVDFWPVRRRGF